MSGRWQDQANCASAPEAMYPGENIMAGNNTYTAYNYARRVCINCDVRAQCLEYALANNETEGMWGGTTPRERRRLLLKKAS